MFNKLSLLALAAPLAHALTLNVPQNPVSGGEVTISWTTQNTDPSSFSIELINQQFNNAFAIANNVSPGQQSITLTLPIVPVGGGYTLEAVDIGNINNVFSSTGSFSVGPNPDSSASTTAPSTTVTGTAPSSASKTAVVSVTTGSHTAASGVSSNSGFGTTTGSAAASGASGASGSAPASAQSTAPSTTPLNGASAFGVNKATLAGALLSALAGAVVVAL